jgi:hypothetical protein
MATLKLFFPSAIIMENLPVYQNLDTSFVKLAALIRYLRERRFVGSIRVEMNGYEADIVIDEENQLKVQEYDRLAGRIAEGEEAFQRLLIRAREPGGTINVYHPSDETGSIEEEIQAPKVVKNAITKPELEREILAQPAVLPFTNNAAKKDTYMPDAPATSEREFSKPPRENAALPFEFSNRVEERARQPRMSPEEWQQFLELTGELLGTIDKTLGAANLNFPSAFAKACAEVSADYPFLNPSSTEGFSYVRGKAAMNNGGEQVSGKLFAAGINEVLRRILEKLGANPKFAAEYRETVQAILALINQRKPLYDKFFITPQLEKTLGVM